MEPEIILPIFQAPTTFCSIDPTKRKVCKTLYASLKSFVFKTKFVTHEKPLYTISPERWERPYIFINLFKYILYILFWLGSVCRFIFSTSLIVLIQVYNWEIRHHSLVCCCGFTDILNILEPTYFSQGRRKSRVKLGVRAEEGFFDPQWLQYKPYYRERL